MPIFYIISQGSPDQEVHIDYPKNYPLRPPGGGDQDGLGGAREHLPALLCHPGRRPHLLLHL